MWAGCVFGLNATVSTHRMLQHLPVKISNCCLASALASPSPALPWPARSVPRSGCAVAWKQSRLLITSENPPHVATPHSSCYLASLAYAGRMCFWPLRHRLYSSQASTLACRNFQLLPSVSSCFSFSSTALACSLCSNVWMRRCLETVTAFDHK